jgi:hypothetical protein
MERDTRQLRRMLKAQDLKRQFAVSKLRQIRVREAQIAKELETLAHFLESEHMSVAVVSQAISKKIREQHVELDKARSHGSRMERIVQAEELRHSKICNWLAVSLIAEQESETIEVTEDSVSNQIHASGRW